MYARASARISVVERGDVRAMELGEALERWRVVRRPWLRFLGKLFYVEQFWLDCLLFGMQVNLLEVVIYLGFGFAGNLGVLCIG